MRGAYSFAAVLFYGTLLAPAVGAAPTSVGNCSIVPERSSAQFPKTIKIDFTGDSTAVLQEALDRLQPNEAVQLAPGTYHISKSVVLRVAGVQLYGAGATLLSVSERQGGLMIQADNVAVYDLTLDQESRVRQSTPSAGGIAIYNERDGVAHAVRGTVIQHNRIKRAAAAGIFVFSAEDFLIADNTVWRSLADGIHITAGSKNGRIIGNTVSQTGDDMIAVVSYAGDSNIGSASERYRDWNAVQAAVSRNILIADNNVFDQYWGRAVSVVGGEQITVSENQIARSPMAAGIYIERESSFKTYGDHDILVRGNHLSKIETEAPSYQPHNDPLKLTGHGAIEIGSLQDFDELSDARYRGAFSVDRVTLIENDIDQARFAGIRIGVGARGTVSEVLVKGNTLSNVSQHSIFEAGEGLRAASVQCLDNRLDGMLWPRRCDHVHAAAAQAVSAARGATLRCSATGKVVLTR